MMSSPWKKTENENGFTYYLNEATKATQWDHPKFSEIKQRLDDCNYIKYSSYRVASKFRVLQNALHMDEIPLTIISGVFERHRLGATESSLCLEAYDIEAVLSDIYFASNKHNHTNTDIDFATELMINFLYNIYDNERKTNIQVLSTKLVLAVLCNGKLVDVYRFIFKLCADHNNCVTRLRLQSLLSKLSDITNYLHENISYGKNFVNSTIESCFKNSPGLVGINENNFISWLETGPEFLSWLPILHRLKHSETVMHSSKCSVCRMTPMIGLRYRCIKCTRYIQCQQCFLTGRISNSHKLTHSMKEHFSENSSSECAYGLIRKIFGLVKCKNNENIAKVVNVKPLSSNDKDWLLNTTPTEVICNIEPLSSPMAQLQVIIRQLELQNRELQQMIVIGNKGGKELKRYLEEHRLHVASQINKLKILKDYLKSSPPATYSQHIKPQTNLCDFVSTPMVATDRIPRFNMDIFSPITLNNHMTTLNEEDLKKSDLTRSKSRPDVTNYSEMPSYSITDISTWLGGAPGSNINNTIITDLEKKSKANFLNDKSENGQSDLDEALSKLQQILANNLILDESLGSIDNGQLKTAVNEVEGMLTSLIDNVETNKYTHVPTNLKF